MDDNKKDLPKNEETPENGLEPVSGQPENDETVKSDNDKNTDGELTGELERLTVLFRDEMKKANESADAGAEEEIIQELDEIKEQVEKEIIPEEELCRCCSERRRDTAFGEDYEYCAKCREGMRHYPLGLQYWVLALVVIALAVVSGYHFFSDFNKLYAIRQAENLAAQHKNTSAAAKYAEAGELFSADSMTAERPALKAIALSVNSITSISAAQDMADGLDAVLSPLEYKLPWNRKYYDLRNQLLVRQATLDAYMAIGEKYQSEDEEDLPYEKILAELETYIGKTVEIEAPKATGGLSVLLFNSGKKIEAVYDADIIRIFQYSLLQTKDSSKDNSDYLIKISEASPDRVWLYGYELGVSYAKSGKYEEALAIADQIAAQNSEDIYTYYLRALTLRIQGDYENGIAACDAGLKIGGENSELYRQKAIMWILSGKSAEALKLLQDIVDQKIQVDVYLETIFTCALAANESKNKTALKKADDLLASHDVEYSDTMKAYFKGKKTAKQIFTSGTYDVI